MRPTSMMTRGRGRLRRSRPRRKPASSAPRGRSSSHRRRHSSPGAHSGSPSSTISTRRRSSCTTQRKTMRTEDDDIVRDGQIVRVRLHLMDDLQREIACMVERERHSGIGKTSQDTLVAAMTAKVFQLLENSPNQCPAIPSRARDTNDTNSTATRHRHDTDRTYHGCTTA